MPNQAETEFQERVAKLKAEDPSLADVQILTIEELYQLEKEHEIFKRAAAAWKEPTADFPIFTDISKSVILDAMSHFMRFVPLAKIEAITGIPNAILRELIYEKGGWKEQRELAYKEAAGAIRAVAASKIRETVGLGIDLILDCFRAIRLEADKAQEAISLGEAEQMANVLRKLHGVQVIEEKNSKKGKKDFAALPPDALIQALAQDPYLKKAIMLAMESKTTIGEEEDERPESEEGENSDL